MTATAELEARPPAGDTDRLIPLKTKAVLTVLAFGLVAFISYGIGTNHGTGAHVVTGRAYVVSTQAGVRADGWAYGFAVDDNFMSWYDARGQFHQGGVPPCMRHTPTFAWIRFGWVNAQGRDSLSWRDVTWVQCINRPG
jgi:hypothetical protein